MSIKKICAKISYLAQKAWPVIKEYWTDFWEGLFPTVS